MLDVYDDGDWVALWPSTPSTAARRAIRGTPDELAGRGRAPSTPCTSALTPNPVAGVDAVGRVRLQHLFGGWAELAAAAGRPRDSTSGAARNLDRLAELESGWPDAWAGRRCCTATSARTTCSSQRAASCSSTGRMRCVGAPAFDLVAWAPSVVLEGGPAPEELLALHGQRPGGRP